MKKTIITLCIALISVCTSAQESIQWEANAGLNIASQSNFSSLIGFHVGVRGKIELPTIAENVYANAGALLTFKGCSFDYGELGSSKIHANYLEFPIHIGYQSKVNENLSLFGEFGPYFSLGLFGKNSSTYYYESEYETENETENDNTFDMYKRFDFGLGFRFGANINQKYTFAIGYDFGLIDCYKGTDDEDDIDLTPSLKNSNLYFSLGYKF